MQPIFDAWTTLFFQYLVPALGVVVTFALAILLHEFGHFVFARLSGVQIEAFSIGFGRRLWGFQRGGTDYRISAIPLGGYVKMKGILSEETERYLEGEDETPAEKPAGEKAAPEPPKAPAEPKRVTLMEDAITSGTALRDKPWPVRVLVFAAGCGFNFLIAVGALATIAWIGTQVDAPLPAIVGTVREGSAFHEAGLRPGDRFVKVAGVPVQVWESYDRQSRGVLNVILARERAGKGDQPIPAVIARGDGAPTTLALTLPPSSELRAALERKENIFGPLVAPAYIGGVLPFSPAHKGGLKEGDIVRAIDGQPIASFNDMQRIVTQAIGRPLAVTVRRGKETVALTITPKADAQLAEKGVIGVMPGNAEKEYFRAGFVEGLEVGFLKAVGMTRLIAVETFGVFARFNVREMKESVGGPLSIFGMSFFSAREGLVQFLTFMAIINIALAIFNLLPIPVLDGGHILITTLETVIRRPLPPRVLAGIYYVFLALILSLFVMVTMFDLLRYADWFGIG